MRITMHMHLHPHPCLWPYKTLQNAATALYDVFLSHVITASELGSGHQRQTVRLQLADVLRSCTVVR